MTLGLSEDIRCHERYLTLNSQDFRSLKAHWADSTVFANGHDNFLQRLVCACMGEHSHLQAPFNQHRVAKE